MMRRKIAITIAIVLIAGSSWFGLKYYRCQSRNAVFSAIIGIRLELDGAGAVAQEPIVVDMYTDCL